MLPIKINSDIVFAITFSTRLWKAENFIGVLIVHKKFFKIGLDKKQLIGMNSNTYFCNLINI